MRSPVLALLLLAGPSCKSNLTNLVSDRDGGTPVDGSGARGNRVFIDPNALDLPDDVQQLFGHPNATVFSPGDGKHDGGRDPRILYPSHETMFPLNVSAVLHQWELGIDNDLVELRFVGPNTQSSVFTDLAQWQPGAAEWEWIAEGNAGAQVDLTVRVMSSAMPNAIYESSTIALYFSTDSVVGAIYYWSTASAAIMKGRVGSRIPTQFYPPPGGGPGEGEACVACHTVSRDGTRLAVSYPGEKLELVDVPGRNVLIERDTWDSAWATFSPDASRLLVAKSGELRLIETDTGAAVGEGKGTVALPMGQRATHPDWSPAGDQIALTVASGGGNQEVQGGSIALMAFLNDELGEPEVIVEGMANDNNFFPAFSPNAELIAYVHANEGSKDAESAALRIFTIATSEIAIPTRLNQRVGPDQVSEGIGNTMPTWAPTTDDGVLWLAFSSLRAYGRVRQQDEKEDQIWIAAIDLDNPGGDPSLAAFWAPFQDVTESNHRGFWAEDTGGLCSCVEHCVDGIDNDCDGETDEADCTTCGPEEICGDELDNDCDCVRDEGCVVCGAEEICGDSTDNDCDGLTDEGCIID